MVEHAGMAVDAMAYALAMDAITHDGPADTHRVGRTPCSQLTMSGFEPSGFLEEAA